MLQRTFFMFSIIMLSAFNLATADETNSQSSQEPNETNSVIAPIQTALLEPNELKVSLKLIESQYNQALNLWLNKEKMDKSVELDQSLDAFTRQNKFRTNTKSYTDSLKTCLTAKQIELLDAIIVQYDKQLKVANGIKIVGSVSPSDFISPPRLRVSLGLSTEQYEKILYLWENKSMRDRDIIDDVELKDEEKNKQLVSLRSLYILETKKCLMEEQLKKFQNILDNPPKPMSDVEKKIRESYRDKFRVIMDDIELSKEDKRAKLAELRKVMDDEIAKAVKEADEKKEEGKNKKVLLPSGLEYEDIVVGTGATPEKGDDLVVNYVGTLTDGTKFDSSYDRNEPFIFSLGMKEVIAGWDEGLATMKVGGKRRLHIPPSLGYGKHGFPPVIPPESTLIFEIELLEIRK